MTFDDPFTGYSLLLRTIVYGLVPAFAALQVVRVRRALHVFQLEGYKRRRFLRWCRRRRPRASFLQRRVQKKPLVMTGRAWRILIVAVMLSVAPTVLLPGIAHLAGGWPYDVTTWAAVTATVFVFTGEIVVAADLLLAPVQSAINARFARRARRRLAEVGPVVVGITGSFGKTSTKFAVAALAGNAHEVLATPASFNTPLGVCRTVNERLSDSHRLFVVEMGAYSEGDIAELCAFVQPRIGVLTAVGPAHLERFGSLDAIRRAKYELIQALPHDGMAVMNVDDPEVRALADATEHVRVVRYGIDATGRPDVTARDLRVTTSGTAFTLAVTRTGRSVDVTTRLLGRHAVGHVLAALAVALETGAALDDLVARVEGLAPVEHRLQLVEGTGGITVIDDAYNSNPAGAAAALEVLAQMPARRRVVVTPGMVELGEMQHDANAEFGKRAAAVADTVVVVARVNRDALVEGAAAAGRAEVVVVDSLADAQTKLRDLLRPGDAVLFENDLPDQYEIPGA